MSTRMLKLLAIAALALVMLGCGGAPSTAASTAEPAGAAEPTTFVMATAVETIVFKVGVPKPLMVAPLEEALNKAARELSNDKTVVNVNIILIPMDGSPIGDCAGRRYPDLEQYDLSLIDSQSALHVFQSYKGKLDPAPDNLLGSIFKPGIQTFTDSETKQVLGLAQGTSPLMMIYNPDLVKQTLPAQPSMDQTVTLAKEFGMAIPPDSSIGVAGLQSALGDEFNEDVIFSGDLMGPAAKFAPVIDSLFSVDKVYSANSDQIVNDFKEQKVGLTLGDSLFLMSLARAGYDGPMAVTAPPTINHRGGSAHSMGWVVLSGSPNAKLAWGIVEKLAQDPLMVQWDLQNGMVPISEAGFNLLAKNPALANNLLPKAVLSDLKPLHDNAAESVAWHIPLNVSIDAYNKVFLPAGNSLVAALADKKVSVTMAAETLVKARSQLK